jgi:general secretion pathway protein G
MAPATTRGERPAAGFTLIELITVIAILGILAAIALPQYRTAILQAKEAVLMENLFHLRDQIDQYYADKGKYPASLQSLVEDGYLKRLPEDPMTRQANWVEVASEPDPDRPDEEAGITDVKSASEEMSTRGTPYNEW